MMVAIGVSSEAEIGVAVEVGENNRPGTAPCRAETRPLRTMSSSLCRRSFESIADHMRTELVLDALGMATLRRRPGTPTPREHSAAVASPTQTGHRYTPNVSTSTQTSYLVRTQDLHRHIT